jgi:hypothetical protein
MHRGLPCSKGKLGSTMLNECCPQAPLQQLPSLAENLKRWRFLRAMTRGFKKIKDSNKISIKIIQFKCYC